MPNWVLRGGGEGDGAAGLIVLGIIVQVCVTMSLSHSQAPLV